jgi:hypothetical protein
LRNCVALLVVVLTVVAVKGALAGEDNGPPDVDTAIKSMRNIHLETLAAKEREAKIKELDAAWVVLVKSGAEGIDGLKKELKSIEDAKEKDDAFRLAAAALFWQLGNVAYAEEIGRIWRTSDLGLNFTSVYITALQAAQTRDPKVVSMLTPILGYKQGKYFVTQHVMNVGWPLTAEFVWGIYGTAGLPALEKIVAESQDSGELMASTLLLTKAQRLSALPAIRKLAEHKDRDVKAMALKCLGIFGHPDDYDLLIKQLRSDDPVIVENVIVGLAQYGDLRAAKEVAVFADSQNAGARKAALAALVEDLLCPASLEALHERIGKFKDPKENAMCADGVDWLLKFVGLKWEDYQAKTPEAREKLFVDTMKTRAQTHALDAKGRKFDHADLLKAAEDWKKQHAISRGTYDWVTGNQIIAAATPEDIDLLIEVRARVYERVSDECLDEVLSLDNAIKNAGRMRFRKEPDLTFKVEKLPEKK